MDRIKELEAFIAEQEQALQAHKEKMVEAGFTAEELEQLHSMKTAFGESSGQYQSVKNQIVAAVRERRKK